MGGHRLKICLRLPFSRGLHLSLLNYNAKTTNVSSRKKTIEQVLSASSTNHPKLYAPSDYPDCSGNARCFCIIRFSNCKYFYDKHHMCSSSRNSLLGMIPTHPAPGCANFGRDFFRGSVFVIMKILWGTILAQGHHYFPNSH